MRLSHRHWRRCHLDIPKQLDQHSSCTDHHHRAEVRVALHTKDKLGVGTHHGGYQEAIEHMAGIAHRSRDGGAGLAGVLLARDP